MEEEARVHLKKNIHEVIYLLVDTAHHAHRNMKFILVIFFKMPTIVGILKYMNIMNYVVCYSVQQK